MSNDGKAYYLSRDEIMILLLQENMEGLTFFEDITSYQLQETGLATAAVTLMQKGLLLAKKDGYFVSAPFLERMRKILSSTDRMIRIQGWKGNTPVQCLYPLQGEVLILQMDEWQRGQIRLEVVTDENVLDSIRAMEYLPPVTEGGLVESENVELSDISGLWETMISKENMLLTLERYPRGESQPDACGGVIRTELCDQAIWKKGKNVRHYIYTKEALDWLMGEAEHGNR